MKAFLIFFVLAVVAIAVIGVTGVLDEAPQLPAAQPIDPPAGAIVLDGVSPAGMINEVRGDPAAAQVYVGSWSSSRGWPGTALKSVRRGDVFRVAMEMHDSTVPGMIVIRMTVPGFPGEIEPDAALMVRGRVASITASSDIMTQPHVIELDQATIMSARNP